MTTSATTIPAHGEVAAPANTPGERLARGGGWWTLFLAMVMLLAVTESLSAAAWSDGLEVVRLAVLGGALLGFMLALTRWDGPFPVVYSILASIIWISTLFTQLVFHDMTFRQGALELFQRNVDWTRALMAGTSGADNLIFVTQLSFLGWWIGYLAIWSLFRHQRLLSAVIPAGVALVVNAYYSTTSMTGYLVMYAAAVLMLAIRVELARNETRWQMTRVRYAPDITLDFLKAGIAFSAVVLVLAWALPDVSQDFTVERALRPFEGPWHRVEDTWNRMYKSLNYSRSAAAVSTFGKSMTFGGPISLTDRPIFDAMTTERTYWRAAVYDQYTSGGWQNTAGDVAIIDPNVPLGEPAVKATSEITTTVYPKEPGQQLIFAPPQPLRLSVPVDADVAVVPGSDDTKDKQPLRSVSLLRSRVRIDQQAGYQAVSQISEASPDELRADSTDYPDWVKARYLQLPDTVPSRVKQLAAQTVANASNPYDKADAIQTLLRTYKYNQDIAAPPAGQDGVDYFLFDVKQGYCDYYASAMVVMLRSLGVPARFAVGYTPGQPKPENHQYGEVPLYEIQERNAHAWPEVYFPTYGWIQFEPTGSEPLIARPVAPPANLDPGPKPNQGPLDLNNQNEPQPHNLNNQAVDVQTPSAVELWLRGHWGWLVGAVVLIAGLVASWRYLRWRQVELFRDSEVLGRLFALLGLWAQRLKVPWRPSLTPLERAAAFNARLPEAAPAVDTIAMLFMAQQYGRQEPAPESITGLSRTWEQLQPRLWKQWAISRVRVQEGTKPGTGRRSRSAARSATSGTRRREG